MSRLRGDSLRRGMALLVALALLALAAALLVGTSAAARATARATRSTSAAVVADAVARQTLASWRTEWDRAAETMTVGQVVASPTVAGRGGAGIAWRAHLTLRRVTADRWLAVAECRAGPDSAVVARRRYLLVIERAPADSAGAPGAPRPVRHWGTADIY